MDRVPFQATVAAGPYDAIHQLPVSVLLDNVRSLYNVGAFFRTADAAGIEKLYLCGITGRPPKRAITKTALGAEETVPWDHSWQPLAVLERMRALGYEIAAAETSVHAVDLFDWRPRFPVSAMRWRVLGRNSRPAAIRTSVFQCSGESTPSTWLPPAEL